jgi:ribonuclease BN (tRNA processing enzyme)
MTSPTESAALGVTIRGSRGSVAVSSPKTVRYGGHTTCVEIDRPDVRIIVDAGSGLLERVRNQPDDDKPTLLLMTHLHWDHVLGFPFYSPLYREGWSLEVQGVPREGRSVLDELLSINKPPLFPVSLKDAIRAKVIGTDLAPTGEAQFGDVRYRWTEVSHPGGCSAFRFDWPGASLVVSGDVELASQKSAGLRELAQGVDVLICDAQYTQQEYESRRGWGHSTNLQAAALAREAGVGRLVMTHHDPLHDDVFIDEMVDEARQVFPRTDAAWYQMRLLNEP